MKNIDQIVEYAKSFYGTFYDYGGDTPMGGVDCSGFVGELLKAAGMIGNGERLSAQMIYERFKDENVITTPTEGALCFYGPNTSSIVHVVFCIDAYFAIGADGGTSSTRTPQDAIKNHAWVKLRPIKDPRYRADVACIIMPNYG